MNRMDFWAGMALLGRISTIRQPLVVDKNIVLTAWRFAESMESNRSQTAVRLEKEQSKQGLKDKER